MIDSGNVKIPEHNDENPTLNDYEELIPIKKDSHQNAHSIYHSPKTQDIFENSLISNSQDSSIPYHNYMNLSGNQGYDSMAAFNNYNPVGSQGSQSILGNNNSNNQMNLANIIKAAQVLKILEEQKKSQRKKHKKKNKKSKKNKKKEGKHKKKKEDKENKSEIVNLEKRLTNKSNNPELEKLFDFFTKDKHEVKKFENNESEFEKSIENELQKYLDNPNVMKYAENEMSKYFKTSSNNNGLSLFNNNNNNNVNNNNFNEFGGIENNLDSFINENSKSIENKGNNNGINHNSNAVSNGNQNQSNANISPFPNGFFTNDENNKVTQDLLNSEEKMKEAEKKEVKNEMPKEDDKKGKMPPSKKLNNKVLLFSTSPTTKVTANGKDVSTKKEEDSNPSKKIEMPSLSNVNKPEMPGAGMNNPANEKNAPRNQETNENKNNMSKNKQMPGNNRHHHHHRQMPGNNRHHHHHNHHHNNQMPGNHHKDKEDCDCDNCGKEYSCECRLCSGHKCKGKYVCKFGKSKIRYLIKNFFKWVKEDCEGDEDKLKEKKIKKLLKFLQKYERCEGNEDTSHEERRWHVKSLISWYYKKTDKNKEKNKRVYK